MKSIKALCVLVLSISPVLADEVINSEPADGIYLQVLLDRTNALSVGSPIYYGFLCTNSESASRAPVTTGAVA